MLVKAIKKHKYRGIIRVPGDTYSISNSKHLRVFLALRKIKIVEVESCRPSTPEEDFLYHTFGVRAEADIPKKEEQKKSRRAKRNKNSRDVKSTFSLPPK